MEHNKIKDFSIESGRQGVYQYMDKSMQISRQHKWVFVIIILLFLGITTCQNLDQSKYSLNCSSYQIPSDKIDTPIRIVQLTDLHNSEFGEDNQ